MSLTLPRSLFTSVLDIIIRKKQTSKIVHSQIKPSKLIFFPILLGILRLHIGSFSYFSLLSVEQPHAELCIKYIDIINYIYFSKKICILIQKLSDLVLPCLSRRFGRPVH